MSELLGHLWVAVEQFVLPFLTFGAMGLWLSIHVVMQSVAQAVRKMKKGRVRSILSLAKHGAPYILGVAGAMLLPIFPEKASHESFFGGILCGFVADKVHLGKKIMFSWLKDKTDDEGKKATYAKIEKFLT